MSKISYSKLNLKIPTKVKTFTFSNQEIEVKQYLPIEDKYDLIMITLKKAYEEGIYNELKLDMFFHLSLIYMYSNISFTEKQRENECKLYDTFKSSGFLNDFLINMNKDEYDELLAMLERIRLDSLAFSNSAAGILSQFINDVPAQAEATEHILKDFDINKFKEALNYAKAVGFQA